MTNCLFCSEPKQTPNYEVSQKDIEYVCSGCVQILLGAEQLHLKRAYEKAIAKGYENKARAIESFLIAGDRNGKQINRRRAEKHSDGKRIDGAARFKKIAISNAKTRKKIALFKNQQDIEAVS